MTLLVRDRRVIAIQAAIGWCLGGLGPALILGSRDLDLPRYQLSWLGSAFGFTLLIAGLLGSRALKRGPMPVVAAGAAMLITGTMLLAFGASLPLLAAGGLLQGAGSSAFLIATPALVVGAGRARRLALAVGASSITGLLAPGAVALADQVFATGRIALMIPTIWIIPFLAPRYWKTAKPIQPPRHPVPSGPHMSRRTWLRWLIIVLGVSAEFCFWTWGAARLVDAGASDSAASGLAAAFAVGMAFGRFIGPMSIGSLDPIVISALVTSSGAAIVVANSAVPLLVAGLLLAGFGIAVVYPVSLTLLLEDPDLPQDRLIALAAYASGVAITITPTMLGLLDRIMAVQYGFGVVPLTMAAVVWLSRVVNPVRNTSR
jgi:MFS family permease